MTCVVCRIKAGIGAVGTALRTGRPKEETLTRRPKKGKKAGSERREAPRTGNGALSAGCRGTTKRGKTTKRQETREGALEKTKVCAMGKKRGGRGGPAVKAQNEVQRCRRCTAREKQPQMLPVGAPWISNPQPDGGSEPGVGGVQRRWRRVRWRGPLGSRQQRMKPKHAEKQNKTCGRHARPSVCAME